MRFISILFLVFSFFSVKAQSDHKANTVKLSNNIPLVLFTIEQNKGKNSDEIFKYENTEEQQLAYLSGLEVLLNSDQLELSKITISIFCVKSKKDLENTVVDSIHCDDIERISFLYNNQPHKGEKYTSDTISNQWESLLYELAKLQVKIRALDKVKPTTEVIFNLRKKGLNEQLVYQTNLEILFAKDAIENNTFWIHYHNFIDTVFTAKQYDQYENLSAYSEIECKQDVVLIFQFTNYDTKYDGPDAEQFRDNLRFILDLIRDNKTISKVRYQTNTIEGMEFLNNISVEKHQGNQRGIKYILSGEEGEKTMQIPNGEITILQQELLALWQIRDLLSISAEKSTIELNYEQDIDDPVTRVIIYFSDK